LKENKHDFNNLSIFRMENIINSDYFSTIKTTMCEFESKLIWSIGKEKKIKIEEPKYFYNYVLIIFLFNVVHVLIFFYNSIFILHGQ
jgi:hypothetical protein